MPSNLHEAIAELFRNRPVLAAEVIERCLPVELPEFKEARLISGDLPKLKPAERRADAVVLLQRKPRDPVLAVIVEVQLREDDRKRRTWPDYLTGLYSRHECPALLLVICPGRKTAAWAAEPIVIGPGFVLLPSVLGPDLVPAVADIAEAQSAPELAILSGIAHGQSKAVRAAAFAAVAAIAAQDVDLAALYAEVIVEELPKALRKTAEEELRIRTSEYVTEFAKFHAAQGRAEGEALGRAEGEALGRAEGRVEGEAEGEAKGKAEAKKESVRTVLTARGIELTPSQQAIIQRCTSLPELDKWLERAVTASTADEVFA